MTNFEKIMQETTIESMATAKALNNYCNGNFDKCLELRDKHKGSTACYFCWLAYLKQEVGEWQTDTLCI